jgi:hypothetical protein
MHSRTILVAAVAAAAAVTSACNSTVTGTASPASDLGPAPAPGTVAAPPLVAGSQNTWINIVGESDPARADALAPGTLIRGLDKDRDMANCSLGAKLVGNAITTAGHCGLAGSPRLLGSGIEVGSVEQSVDKIPGDGPVLDFAVVKLNVPVSNSPVHIAGRPVAGVLKVKAADALRAGTSVCFVGVKSGIGCGPLVSADPQGITVDVASAAGDSGSPVFVVDGRTQTVTLIGLLSGRVDGSMGATYLDVALDAAGTEALVDANAAGMVAAGNPDYSLRVSPQ